jgi:YesN/AraC family two-component response regulator
MTMPSMNGAQLVKSILDICPDMPVVLCSGFSELMNETKARAIGVRQYVLKPVMRIEIAQAVRRALDE